MSLNWEAMQTAIETVVQTASGFPADRVVWAFDRYQGRSRPAGNPFIRLAWGTLIPRGIPEVWTKPADLTRDLGEEIELVSNGKSEVTLSLQCYGGTPVDNYSAFAIMSRVRSKLALPTLNDQLVGAGLSPFSLGTLQDIPAVEGTKFEARAKLDLRCYVDCSESEWIGYIASVEMTGVCNPVTLTGTVTMTNGSAAVTGSGTAFDTEIRVHHYVRLTADNPTDWAQVAAIADATHLTLASNYTGAGGSGAARAAGSISTFTETGA